MKNIIPQAFDRLLSFADLVTAGLHALAVILGVVHNGEDALRADADGARKANSEYQAAVTATKLAFAAKEATGKEVKAYIVRAREVLKPILGQRYNVAWREAGFLTPTLRVPKSLDVQQNMLMSLSAYFTAHPEAEVADWDVTAVRAKELHDALAAQAAAASAAASEQRQKRIVRDAAVAALDARARALRNELKQLLEDNDPRWLDFGFSVPADVSTPQAPEGLTVTAGGAGEALLSWGHTVNADRYQIYQEVVGVDTKPVKAASVTETSKELRNLPTGAHVKFYVTAINSAGESLPSEVMELVIP